MVKRTDGRSVQGLTVSVSSHINAAHSHRLTSRRVHFTSNAIAVGKVKRPCTAGYGRHDVLTIPTQISSNALEQGQRRVHKGLLRRGIRPTIMPRLSGHACRLPTANPFSLPRPNPAIPGHCDVMGEAG